jgi:hypothetical protein
MTAIYLKEKKDYNGWANRQTWNVSLWINNDPALYQEAVEFMKVNPDKRNPYKAFVISSGLESERTPDKIAYMSTRLNYNELNAMMKDFL